MVHMAQPMVSICRSVGKYFSHAVKLCACCSITGLNTASTARHYVVTEPASPLGKQAQSNWNFNTVCNTVSTHSRLLQLID